MFMFLCCFFFFCFYLFFDEHIRHGAKLPRRGKTYTPVGAFVMVAGETKPSANQRARNDLFMS